MIESRTAMDKEGMRWDLTNEYCSKELDEEAMRHTNE
jgi:hypothetical protein